MFIPVCKQHAEDLIMTKLFIKIVCTVRDCDWLRINENDEDILNCLLDDKDISEEDIENELVVSRDFKLK